MKTISTYDIGILGKMDATAVAEKIIAKEFSSEDAVSCAIERAKRSDEDLNAIVNDNYERALSDAMQHHDGIFSGVPTFIKDLNDVAGLPTLKGCSGFKIKPVKKNDKIVNQFLSVTGSVVLGKSSTSEFGLLPCGETIQNGETRNPWNTDHSTGGSSAGSAALVAAGVVPFAHASDGGGSIRIPASCCGLVGLKPSRGRNITSPTAIVPVNIAEDGMVSRTVRDTANFYAALEKYYSNPKLPQIGHVKHAGKKRLRIALFSESPTGMESHHDVTQAALQAGILCEELGHHVSYIKNPFEHKITRDFLVYWSSLAFASMAAEYAQHGIGFNHLKAAKFTKQLGSFFPLLLLRAGTSIRNLKNHANDYNKLFDTYDVLLSPTLSHPAPPIGYFGTEVDTIDVIMKLNGYVNFTTTQNITGAPAISLPMFLSKEGLPIGIQFAANVGEERKLLELAFEIEEAQHFKTLDKVKKQSVAKSH
ncbi:MAG: amidase [Bacteroidota bacterium]|nr:amidase [Bacteroidota bacterium]